MKGNHKNWVVLICVLGPVLSCGVTSGLAEEEAAPVQTEGAAGQFNQDGPLAQFGTEGDFFLGYRWVSTEDALKAAEYIYPHSSATLGLNLLSCPLPYRYHVNAELVSSYDHYTDAGFAYKDILLFRDILVGVHHNLDHYPIQFEATPGFTYDDRNATDNYFVDFRSNLLSLRLKVPNFALHGFVNQRHVEREGREQQRFLRYSYADHPAEPYIKTSQSRDIDWTSDALKLGTNSHLGPVEVEYAFEHAEFDPGNNFLLTDSYSYPPYPQTSPFYIGEKNDTYPHHVDSETESSANTVKLHSSYTGGIVTGATLGHLQQKNNFSGAESTTWKGAFDFSWIPKPKLGLFFKYRHTSVDLDTPSRVTLTGLIFGSVNTYAVRQGISYDKDVLTLSSRYRMSSNLSLYANYNFSHLERRHVEAWILLPDNSDIHSIDLKGRFKPLKGLQFTAGYEFKKYHRPSYNIQPDTSNKVELATTYTPSPTINLYLDYNLSFAKRDSLRYPNSDFTAVEQGGNRDECNHQLLASLSKELTSKASITASWYFQRGKIEQDLAYGKMLEVDSFARPYIDAGVSYVDQSNSFNLALTFLPQKDISMVASVSHTITKGTNGYTDVVGDASYSLSSFSELKAVETLLALEVTKRLLNKYEIGLESYFGIYDDEAYDLLDGKVGTATFKVRRYF